MRQLFIFILITFTLQSATAQANKTAGQIFDFKTKLPLEGATIILRSITDSKKLFTKNSAPEGNFSFDQIPAGVYNLTVSFSGYESLQKDSLKIGAQGIKISSIYLKKFEKDLATVTLIGKKQFMEIKGDKITLNIAESPIAAAGNAWDAVKKTPGMSEQDNELSFRGKSINVLINGRPTHISGEDLKNMLTNMQASGVEKVEILPTPSAKYDAQGGSVVNIVLAKNKNFGTSYVLNVGAGTGRFPNTTTGLDINYRNKNLNIYGGFNYNYEKQYIDNNTIRFLPDSKLNSREYDLRVRNNTNIKAGADYDINEKTSFGIFVNGFLNNRDRIVENTSVLHYLTNKYDSSAVVNTKGIATFRNFYVNTYLTKKLKGTGENIAFNFDYYIYDKQWNDNFITNLFDENGLPYINPAYLRDYSPANINVYSISSDYTKPVKNGQWEAGIKAAYTNTDNNVIWENRSDKEWVTDQGKTNHFIYKENVNALYVNRSFIKKKWQIEAGLRLEQTNTQGYLVNENSKTNKSSLDFFPNINLSKAINNIQNITFTYRKSVQRFGLDYVNPFIIYENAYAYRQGNADLKAQKNHSISISYIPVKSLWVGFSWQHSVKTLGAKYINDGNKTISTYGNFKGSDFYYGYVNYNVSPIKRWKVNAFLYAGFFKLKLEENSGGEKKNNKPFLSASIQNTFPLKNDWNAELSDTYLNNVSSGIAQLYSNYNIDAGVSKGFHKNKLVLRMAITDVLNSSRIKVKIDYQGYNALQDQKQETRFIKLSAKYNFGNTNVKKMREKKSKIEDIKNRIN